MAGVGMALPCFRLIVLVIVGSPEDPGIDTANGGFVEDGSCPLVERDAVFPMDFLDDDTLTRCELVLVHLKRRKTGIVVHASWVQMNMNTERGKGYSEEKNSCKWNMEPWLWDP